MNSYLMTGALIFAIGLTIVSETSAARGVFKMKTLAGLSALILVFGATPVLPQVGDMPADFSVRMEIRGGAVASENGVHTYSLDEFPSDIPTDQLSKIAQGAVSEITGATRSAKGCGNLQKDLTISSLSRYQRWIWVGLVA